MASQGPLSPGTVDTVPGDVDWTNPSNVTASDDVYATSALITGQFTYLLRGSNFGFTIPSDALIDGVVLEIERNETLSIGGAHIRDVSVQVGTGSNDKADTATDWTTTDTYIVYGSSIDTWGLVLTPATVNATGFYGKISAKLLGAGSGTARIDHMRMTIYYTAVDVEAGDLNESSYVRPHPRWTEVEAVMPFF